METQAKMVRSVSQQLERGDLEEGGLLCKGFDKGSCEVVVGVDCVPG